MDTVSGRPAVQQRGYTIENAVERGRQGAAVAGEADPSPGRRPRNTSSETGGRMSWVGHLWEARGHCGYGIH